MLSLFGGGGSRAASSAASSHGSGGSSSYGHGQGHGHGGGGATAQIFKVIIQQGQGYSNGGGGYASGYSHGSNFAASPVTQIYKVIEQGGGAAVSQGYSHGQSYASHHQNYAPVQSYGGGHGHGSSGGFSLDAILPQILQLVLEGGDSGFGGSGGSSGGGGYNDQLIAHYGTKGSGIARRSNGKMNSYYKSGHVVESGTLKVMRVHESTSQRSSSSAGGAAGGIGGKLQQLSSSSSQSGPAQSSW